jgi:hypothetical protein
MTRFRRLCATALLTVVLAASSALAGHLPMGVTSEPPPPAEDSVAGQMPMGITSPSSDASVAGNMPFGVAAGIDPVTESMLGLLQSVLALF